MADGASCLESVLARRGDPVAVRVVRLPRRFLSRQSSALVQYLRNGTALPTHQDPPVRERGVRRAPALVQNAETLARLGLIARYGADWFRSAGTPAQPGSALCTVHLPGREVRVVQAPFGLPLHRLLPLEGLSAVLAGGCHGIWIPAAEAARLRLDAVSIGAGVLAALPADRCGLAETARVLRYRTLRPASMAPASTACPASLPPSTPRPPPAPRHASARTSPAGPASSRAAAPATTPTARSGWCAAP